MKLIIVSGLSGAGKTVALRCLEDMGAYCIDNLPVGMLPVFAEQLDTLGIINECVVLGIDSRTTALHDMPALLKRLQLTKVSYQILFLEADEEILIKRFNETRRKHPLTKHNIPLSEAIQHEYQLLKPLAKEADVHIDTSLMHVHQLRDLINIRISFLQTESLSLLFQSFGFKHGTPNDTHFVFDVRCLPNPYWEIELRKLTGRDEAVINFLQNSPKVQQMYQQLVNFFNYWIPQFADKNHRYLNIAFGCTGGQHRSVYLTERLAKHFSQQNYNVLVQHQQLSVKQPLIKS